MAEVLGPDQDVRHREEVSKGRSFSASRCSADVWPLSQISPVNPVYWRLSANPCREIVTGGPASSDIAWRCVSGLVAAVET